jgi:hypothetical protein
MLSIIDYISHIFHHIQTKMASPSGGDQQQAISVMVTISKADFAVKHILYGVDPHHGVGGEHGYVCVHVSKMPKYYYVQGLQSDAKGRETDYQCEVCGIVMVLLVGRASSGRLSEGVSACASRLVTWRETPRD